MPESRDAEDLILEVERLRVEVAELRLALGSLAATEQKHRLLLETTDTAFLILDEQGRVLDANQEYVRLTGRSELSEILGRSVVEWTAPHDLERNADEVRKCMASGTVRDLEIDYVDQAGRVIPVEINATIRHTGQSAVIFTICRDITERRKAEEALRNSGVEYRTTIDAFGDMIHVVDPDLRIVLMNQAGCHWSATLGGCAAPVGQALFDVFPFLLPAVRDQYRAVFDSGRQLDTEERTTIGSVEYVTETRKIPILERGRVARVLTVVRDTTAAVRAQERLRHAEKMEAMGQLAGGIAHDFNNQLAAMLGYAELLERRVAGDELREFARMIARSAARSAELTRQLLAFARKGRYRTVPVDVHELVGEVVALLSRTIDKRIAVRTRLTAARCATLGDPVQLQNALLNLAINARDAMPDGGVLSFSTDVVLLDADYCRRTAHDLRPGQYLRISVEDTGVGMTEETKRHLFEPFFTTKEPGKGTGMGLAAVYGTVLNHDGDILVTSEPGQGSLFQVHLPLLESPGEADESAASESAQGSAHILLADDEGVVREMAEAALRELGYRVTSCANGAEALELYQRGNQAYDLVILDMVMPNLNGPDTFLAIRHANPSARILLASGYSLDNQTQRLLDAGAMGFIQKPFHIQELALKVAAALG